MKRDLKPATIAAHAAGAVDKQSAGVVPPIQTSTTFMRDETYALIRPDNIYSRDDSDTVRTAEQVITKLEQAEDTLLFPAGMAAIAGVFRTLLAGDTALVQSGIYWGTTKWIRDFCARRDVTLHEVEASDAAALKTACQAHRPTLVFIETPSNPWLRTVDVAAAAQATHAVAGTLVVDATAATPILMKPLALGADIVMHSATKAINGHSDVLAGVLSTNAPTDPIWEAIKMDRHDAGAVLGPFEAWLLIRAMRTLPLRVERMTENAVTLAQYLHNHPQVEDVFYPGLPHHPGHEVAKQQMSGYGSLLSVLVKGGRAEALKVVGKLQLFLRATSLGGVESLVEHRHTIEPHTGIPENLIRVSVGIEHIDDLKDDWEQALS
ncbi:aminotransferase class I/II-fold pyridoxal phosphate-dependent enzyme [Loktanella sp. F6476L]|uniref:trans-sulfuration enzyme family protein n=1 Tax=Loktanella sp. F6476L TaxID=2926405 RepID=UPI001FF2E66A|nr:aminotransferase class I/II-fold pyridoxal phosphate-dependent enzyme [Loktanella sp. F6476L]MCK0121864.1 aminotransferase class I/II-fold pyridoxal phosphate-dependent enzyme [Loktanella sp. F6476L]